MAERAKKTSRAIIEGPHKKHLAAIAREGDDFKWTWRQFKTGDAMKAILSLDRVGQRTALLALFHEIGMSAERSTRSREQPRDWLNLHLHDDRFNAFCVAASLLLRRDHNLTPGDWLIILRDVGKFPFISLGLSHDYANPLLGSIERDAHDWDSIPAPLRAAIERVAQAIGSCSDNAPQQKASERLRTILRRFEAKAALISREGASWHAWTETELRAAAEALDRNERTLRPFPAGPGDPLASAYALAQAVCEEALRPRAWIGLDVQKLDATKAVFAYEPRSHTLIAAIRWNVWLRVIGRKQIAFGEGNPHVRNALHLMAQLVDRLSQKRSDLTEAQVADIVQLGDPSRHHGRCWVPSAALINIMWHHSRTHMLPEGACQQVTRLNEQLCRNMLTLSAREQERLTALFGSLQPSRQPRVHSPDDASDGVTRSAAFLLDNYITTLAQKPPMTLNPGDEPRPTTLDDILAASPDMQREVLREALVMLAWLRDPRHPPPPPRWDKWHFECVPHRILESLYVAILHRQPPLDDELLMTLGDALLHQLSGESAADGIPLFAVMLEHRLSRLEPTMDFKRLATRVGEAISRRRVPAEQRLAELISSYGAGVEPKMQSTRTAQDSLLPAAAPSIRTEITSLLTQLSREVVDMEVFRGHVFGGCPSFAVLCGLPADRFPELLGQVSARHDELVGPDGTMNTGGWATNPGCRERLALLEIIASHLPKAVEGRPDVLTYLCAWVASQNDPVQALDRIDEGVLRAVERHAKTNELTPPMTAWVMNCRERWVKYPKTHATRIKRSGALVTDELIIDLDAGEPWAARLLADVADATPAVRATWTHLIDHCMGSSGSAPSGKWSTRASELVKTIGKRDFEAAALRWLPLINEPRTTVATSGYYQLPIGSIQLLDRSMNTLRGLCWAVSLAPTPTNTTDIARMLGQLVLSAYRKVPGRGPRAILVGNAAIHALGQMKGPDALGQLAMLRVKVKFGVGQKMLEKALNAAATREGLPRDEIEELAVPSYGLTDVGVRAEEIGEYLVELRIEAGGTLDLTFTKRATDAASDGKAKSKPPKAQKSVPASIKAAFADDLKELKAAAKDIASMLPAQRDRIDSLFVENKSWPLATWRERYLDHPLVGTIARRLIWTFTPPADSSAASAHATWLGGSASLVTVDGAPFTPAENASVSLWHPINHATDDIIAWRRFFEDRQIRQPFKQAHREVYILTDAERNTGTYSNRYAAHIIRQHQFNALCGARHWKNKLRLMVDAEYPPATRHLRAFGLRAEFWVEGAGDDYGVHTNEAGTFHFLATDQVRFYNENAAQGTAHAGGGAYVRDHAAPGNPINEPISLDQIPALAFSEIMRDVDLFVGVGSIGNNPQWSDGGPTNEHRDYWWQFSFGEMSESGKARRDILSRLVPRLKIAPVSTLSEQFLVVKGKLRTYKIHLGSGNILMEPNDQYLCIVPSSRDETSVGASGGPGVFLPFEGDRTLSIILSKAFMLAADDTIVDPSIRSQIARR